MALFFLWEYVDKHDLDKRDTAVGMLDAETVRANNDARLILKTKLLDKIERLKSENPGTDYYLHNGRIKEKESWMIEVENKVEELNSPFIEWARYPRYVIQDNKICIVPASTWQEYEDREKIIRFNKTDHAKKEGGTVVWSNKSLRYIDAVTEEPFDIEQLPTTFEYPKNTPYNEYHINAEKIAAYGMRQYKLKF